MKTAALGPIRRENGFVKWFDGSRGYAITEAAFDVLTVAADALSQPGVRDESDPRVAGHIENTLPPSALQSIGHDDRIQLRELGYGFVFNLDGRMSMSQRSRRAGGDQPTGLSNAPSSVLWETQERLEYKPKSLDEFGAENMIRDELDERGISVSQRHINPTTAGRLAEATAEKFSAGYGIRESWNAALAASDLPAGLPCPATIQTALAARFPGLLRQAMRRQARQPGIGGAWREGKTDGYLWQALVFDEGGSDYGINDGRVSKLTIGPDEPGGTGLNKAIYNFDRGLDFDRAPAGLVDKVLADIDQRFPAGTLGSRRRTAAGYVAYAFDIGGGYGFWCADCYEVTMPDADEARDSGVTPETLKSSMLGMYPGNHLMNGHSCEICSKDLSAFATASRRQRRANWPVDYNDRDDQPGGNDERDFSNFMKERDPSWKSHSEGGCPGCGGAGTPMSGAPGVNKCSKCGGFFTPPGSTISQLVYQVLTGGSSGFRNGQTPEGDPTYFDLNVDGFGRAHGWCVPGVGITQFGGRRTAGSAIIGTVTIGYGSKSLYYDVVPRGKSERPRLVPCLGSPGLTSEEYMSIEQEILEGGVMGTTIGGQIEPSPWSFVPSADINDTYLASRRTASGTPVSLDQAIQDAMDADYNAFKNNGEWVPLANIPWFPKGYFQEASGTSPAYLVEADDTGVLGVWTLGHQNFSGADTARRTAASRPVVNASEVKVGDILWHPDSGLYATVFEVNTGRDAGYLGVTFEGSTYKAQVPVHEFDHITGESWDERLQNPQSSFKRRFPTDPYEAGAARRTAESDDDSLEFDDTDASPATAMRRQAARVATSGIEACASCGANRNACPHCGGAGAPMRRGARSHRCTACGTLYKPNHLCEMAGSDDNDLKPDGPDIDDVDSSDFDRDWMTVIPPASGAAYQVGDKVRGSSPPYNEEVGTVVEVLGDEYGSVKVDWPSMGVWHADPSEIKMASRRVASYGDPDDIPADFPVRPLRRGETAKDKASCGNCGLSWDDAIATSMTPTPSGRCPFEEFHHYDSYDDETTASRRVAGADAWDYEEGTKPFPQHNGTLTVEWSNGESTSENVRNGETGRKSELSAEDNTHIFADMDMGITSGSTPSGLKWSFKTASSRRVAWDAPAASTKIKKNEDGEYVVKSYDANGNHLKNSDYFTDDKDDAEATAKAMVNASRRTAGNDWGSLPSDDDEWGSLPGDEPEGPQEDDITTEDQNTFWQGGKVILRVDGNEDWRPAIRAHMEKEGWFPNVWQISDHGNAHLLTAGRRHSADKISGDPRLDAIRNDPTMGRGTGSVIDEAYDDRDLIEEMDAKGIDVPELAVQWALRTHEIWRDRMEDEGITGGRRTADSWDDEIERLRDRGDLAPAGTPDVCEDCGKTKSDVIVRREGDILCNQCHKRSQREGSNQTA